MSQNDQSTVQLGSHELACTAVEIFKGTEEPALPALRLSQGSIYGKEGTVLILARSALQPLLK